MNCIKEFFEIIQYHVTDFAKNWIWPAYSLRNCLFKRYDLVKMPDISRFEYSDDSFRMRCAIKEIIAHFVEKENPEEHVEWRGEYGHVYHASDDLSILKEYDGKYVIDMIYEMHRYFKEECPKLMAESSYLLNVWSKHFTSINFSEMTGNEEFSVMNFDDSKAPKTMEELEKLDLDWKILDKWMDGDRSNILKKGFLSSQITKSEEEINNLDRKYLLMAVELRLYMWT